MTDRAKLLADQLVTEIKTAAARVGLRSSRALAREIGESSQYLSMRLDGGSPRTGERVSLNISDLAKIGDAVGVPASELLRRAEVAVAATDRDDVVPDGPGATPTRGGGIAPSLPAGPAVAEAALPRTRSRSRGTTKPTHS